MRFLEARPCRLGFATLVLFTGIAGDFWRDLLTWYGWGAIVAIIVAWSTLLIIHHRRDLRLRRLPYPLVAFLVLAAASIAWSDYRPESVLGLAAQLVTTASAVAVVIVLSWAELLVVLGWVFRLVLGMSILFELVVSVFIRHPIFPVWVVPDNPAHPAALLYWSRDLLFSLGKIQGIVGNSSLLAMAALLGLIVFVVQLLERSTRRGSAIAWIVIAIAIIGITRSATIFLALAAVALAAIAVVIVRAARTPRARTLTYSVLVIVAAASGTIAVILRTPILHLLGKSSDFTGRSEIWAAVIHLAQQRPAVGWGWISYWVPWVAPFNHLIVKGGVQVLHAHNAWLDVWLQLGVVGLVVFGAFVLSTLVRSWLVAIDRPVTASGMEGSYSWVALLPLLMFVAQLVQSLAESRMLVEGGWMLLVIWAAITKWSPAAHSITPERSKVAM